MPGITKTEALVVRGFKAKLPPDFEQLLMVTTIPKLVSVGRKKPPMMSYTVLRHLPMLDVGFMSNQSQEIACRSYYINQDVMFFCGRYHKFFLFRWVQIMVEWIWPTKIIVKYIPSLKTP